MGSDPTGAFGAIRRRPWVSLLILLFALSGALLIVLRANIGFFLDDWALVIFREGSATDWLLPHNEHIIVLPAAIYKLSLSVFGMTAMPLHLLAVVLFLVSIFLLYLWLRPLVGEPLAVLGCAVMLFLGAATEDLIWAFQIGFFGSVSAGLGALLLMRNGSLGRDTLACLLLVASVLFSSVAIPFAVGAAVWLLLREGSRPRWDALVRRSWIFVVPGLVYIGWWLGWGHLASNAISLGNVAKDPLYVLSALGYSASVLTGTFPLRTITESLVWAVPGLIVASGFYLVLRHRRRLPPEFLVAAAIGLVFWGLSGLNYIPGREFTSSRYAYPSAIILLMLLGGAFSGWRPEPRALRITAAVAAFAVLVNGAVLVYSFHDRYQAYEEKNLVSLTTFDIASETVDPEFGVGISTDDGAKVYAGDYLEATARYGSPGLSDDQIEQTSEANRERIDQFLVQALVTRPIPLRQVTPDRGSCRTLTADQEASDTTEVDSRLLFIEADQQVLIRLGRFGDEATAPAWAAYPNYPVGYLIPEDNSGKPWKIGFEGSGEVTVCDARPAG